MNKHKEIEAGRWEVQGQHKLQSDPDSGKKFTVRQYRTTFGSNHKHLVYYILRFINGMSE